MLSALLAVFNTHSKLQSLPIFGSLLCGRARRECADVHKNPFAPTIGLNPAKAALVIPLNQTSLITHVLLLLSCHVLATNTLVRSNLHKRKLPADCVMQAKYRLCVLYRIHLHCSFGLC